MISSNTYTKTTEDTNTHTPQDNAETTNYDHWLVSSLDKFAESMYFQEGQSIEVWTEALLAQLTPFVGGLQATLYSLDKSSRNKVLKFMGGYALVESIEAHKEIKIGEGIIGLVSERNEMRYLTDKISYQPHLSTVTFVIDALLVLPLSFNKKVCGVLEVAFLKKPEQKYINLLSKLSERIAANLNMLLIMDKLEESNKIIEAKNHNITASINYARRIQNTFLPSKSRRLEVFPQSFLIYQPLDIVSGDFFWIVIHENIKIACVADCTGHGVPAAFMSLMGHSLLNEAVMQKHILSPDKIIEYLHHGIYNRLNTDKEQLRDGMDIGICFIEYLEDQTIKIIYAGAKQGLLVVNENGVTKYAGSRVSLGYSKNFEVTNAEAILHKNDILYLSTDGYIDQANQQRHRFGSGNLVKLLAKNCHKPMEVQKEILETSLFEFMGGTSQRDDITFLGIKL
jgi:serine phosphatase RsbU (regulator of sigma subunit)